MSKTNRGSVNSSQQNSGNTSQGTQGKPQSYGTVPSQKGANQSTNKATKK